MRMDREKMSKKSYGLIVSHILVEAQPKSVVDTMVIGTKSSSSLEVKQSIHEVSLLKVQQPSIDEHLQIQCR